MSQSRNLRESIMLDNDFFKSVIDTVPAMQYFDSDTKENIKQKRNKHMDEKVQEIEKGRQTSLDWSDKAKLKRARFDPKENATVSQVQSQLESEREEEEPVQKKQKKKKTKRQMQNKQSGENDDFDELKSSTSSLEDLRQKLQAKISSLQAKRKNFSTYDKMQRLKMKRQESKMKRRLKLKNNEHKQTTTDGGSKVVKPSMTNSKPVYNKEGKMVFSKFDFTDIGDGDKKSKKEKSKDFKRLLQKAEQQRDQVRSLENTDLNKAKNLEERQKWDKVIKKAEGVKVRDDPQLLKKAIKRKEKIKQKSANMWEERTKKSDERVKARQEKRQKNIKRKKESTIKKKVNKAKKKGRVIPGF